MQWIRVDANLDDHPKSVEAGFWGVCVVQVVWRMIKRHGDRGHLDGKYVTERHLRHVTRCDDATAARLVRGLSEAAAAGFLVINGDGSIDAHGWDDVQWDSTHAERQRKYRERKMQRDGGDESRDAVTHVTGTPPHPTPPQPHPTEQKGSLCPSPPAPVTPTRKEASRAKHIGPDTDEEGLDTIDLCRRAYARLWRNEHGGNGATYPDQPDQDRKHVASVLGYHKRNKIQHPWKAWISCVFSRFLAIRNDKMVVENNHALRFLPMAMPRLVDAVAADLASRPAEESPAP